jgi:hypothetical protein
MLHWQTYRKMLIKLETSGELFGKLQCKGKGEVSMQLIVNQEDSIASFSNGSIGL